MPPNICVLTQRKNAFVGTKLRRRGAMNGTIVHCCNKRNERIFVAGALRVQGHEYTPRFGFTNCYERNQGFPFIAMNGTRGSVCCYEENHQQLLFLGLWAGCLWLAVVGCGCCFYCKTAPLSHKTSISPKNKHHSRARAPGPAQML